MRVSINNLLYFQISNAILMEKSESKSFELIWIHSYLCCVLFPFPFGMEVLQELFHPIVAGDRLLFAGFRMHAVLQQEQFFVEVADRIAVRILTVLGIIKRPVFMPAVCKCAGDADCADCIQAISILYDPAFDRFQHVLVFPLLEGKVVHDVDDLLDDGVAQLERPEDVGDDGFAVVVGVAEFMVGYIMQKGRQADDEAIAFSLRFGDVHGRVVDPQRMPPIMPRSFVPQLVRDDVFHIFDNDFIAHPDAPLP